MTISIAFAVNNLKTKQLATAIVSIMENYKGKEDISFYVLHNNLDEEHKKNLLQMCKCYYLASIDFINVEKHINESLIKDMMFNRKDNQEVSTETWYSLLIPDLLLQCNKVLFLDYNIICLDDIEKLYNIDINGYYAGAVRDKIIESQISDIKCRTEIIPWTTFNWYAKNILYKNNDTYFNSDVLLMNLSFMRNDNIGKKLWSFAKFTTKLEYMSQDVFNSVLEEKIKFLDDRWNVVNPQKNDISEIGIINCTSNFKPWAPNTKLSQYNIIEEWWKYYQKTLHCTEEDRKKYLYIKNSYNKSKENKKKKHLSDYFIKRYSNKTHNILKICGIKFKYKKDENLIKLEQKLSYIEEKFNNNVSQCNKLSSRILALETYLVRNSGLFDSEYYIRNYHPEMKKNTALSYYMTKGWKLKENPSEEFDAKKYTGYSNINPIIDYVLRGRFAYARAFWENKYPVSDEYIQKYWEQKNNRKSKTKKVLYTCITNDFDDLEEIKGLKYTDNDFDYICFTDNEEHIKKGRIGIWETRPLVCNKYSNSLNNRWHKINPHLLFPEYTESVYIDGNVNILTSKFFDMIKNTDKDILIPEHPMKADMYQEIVSCCGPFNERDFSEKIANQFKDEGFPINYGMFENNVIYRKHHEPDIISIMKGWWSYMEAGAKRDQVCLAYLFWKHNRKIKEYAFETPRSDYQNFCVFIHKEERN